MTKTYAPYKMLGKSYWKLSGKLSHYGLDKFTPKNREKFITGLLAIKRLANKHLNLAVMDCNGVGFIRGVCYYNGTIDDYACRTYGKGVKSAYLPPLFDETIFDMESSKIEDKIRKIAKEIGVTIETQGDPRGYTVRVKLNESDISDITNLVME